MSEIRVLNEMQVKQNGVSATYKIGSVEGYYNTSDGKFYLESTYETGLEAVSNFIYINLEDSSLYYYDEINETYVKCAGGGGDASLTKAITTAIAVGGISTGTTYPVGTDLEKILSDMLEPTLYPTLTNPSASMTATGSRLLETGSTQFTTFTITFNRGSINPAYGTNGKRAGEATSYTMDGITQSLNVFTATVDSSKTSFQASVAYEAGQQPKDSKGKNYNSPLPAGSVNTNTLTYEFVDALWANTTEISTISKLALVSKTAKVKEFSFPAQTVANPEVFDIPASWTVTAVETLNTLSNQWENCSSEFNVSDTTHDNAAGESVAYKRYTDNRGYNAGTRKVRVKWN